MGAGCCSNKAKILNLNPEHEWRELMKTYKIENLVTAKSQKLRDLVFQGIPSYLRWEIWMKLLNSSPNKTEYEDLVKSMTLNPQIDKDIHRTFPGETCISSEQGQNCLKNILNALSTKLSSGYWQGMNYISAVCLIQSVGNEIESYSFLLSFFNNFQVIQLFDESFKLVKSYCSKFHEVLKSLDPALSEHISSIGLDDSLYIFKWFLTLFTYSFSFKTVLRFWDVLLNSELNFSVNISLSIILSISSSLITKQLDECLSFLESLEVDPNEILIKSKNIKIDWP